MKSITAADANRHFSSLLRTAEQGEEVLILSRGKPVAIISPVLGQHAQQQLAKASLLARLQDQTVSGERNWTREELYE